MRDYEKKILSEKKKKGKIKRYRVGERDVGEREIGFNSISTHLGLFYAKKLNWLVGFYIV